MQNDQGCFGIPNRQNPPRSQVVFTDTGHAYGSTNSDVRYFNTPQSIVGTDLSPVSSSALGTVVYVKTAGVYTVMYYGDALSSGGWYPLITQNSPNLTTAAYPSNPYIIAAQEVAAGQWNALSATVLANPGDFFACQTINGSRMDTNGASGFRVVRVT